MISTTPNKYEVVRARMKAEGWVLVGEDPHTVLAFGWRDKASFRRFAVRILRDVLGLDRNEIGPPPSDDEIMQGLVKVGEVNSEEWYDFGTAVGTLATWWNFSWPPPPPSPETDSGPMPTI
jgi:hypothetical protein